MACAGICSPPRRWASPRRRPRSGSSTELIDRGVDPRRVGASIRAGLSRAVGSGQSSCTLPDVRSQGAGLDACTFRPVPCGAATSSFGASKRFSLVQDLRRLAQVPVSRRCPQSRLRPVLEPVAQGQTHDGRSAHPAAGLRPTRAALCPHIARSPGDPAADHRIRREKAPANVSSLMRTTY